MGWLYHIRYSLAEGAGWGLVIAALAGFLFMLLPSFPRKRESILFLSFPAMFYLHLALRSQRFSRYGYPLLPFIAIGAAFLLFGVLMPRVRTRMQRFTVFTAAFAVLIPTAMKAVRADALFSGHDTRVLATKWVEENIPAGAGIAVDHTSFRPQVLQTREQMLDKKAVAGYQKGMKEEKSRKIDLIIKASEGRKTYNVYFMSNKPEIAGQFLSTVPAISYDAEDIGRTGVSYVVINYNLMFEEKRRLKEYLDKNGDIIAKFSPYHDGKIRPRYDPIDATFMAIGDKELYSRRVTGPCLVIYKLNKK
jgi:hypothetical protein